MQHDNVLKKLNFELLNSPQGRGDGGMRAKHLLPYACCCICYSIKFDMQHDHVLKRLNFDVLTPGSGVAGVCVWGGGGLRQNTCYNVAACVICLNLISNMTMF